MSLGALECLRPSLPLRKRIKKPLLYYITTLFGRFELSLLLAGWDERACGSRGLLKKRREEIREERPLPNVHISGIYVGSPSYFMKILLGKYVLYKG